MNKLSSSRFRDIAKATGAGLFWRMPGRFAAARMLGRNYKLRCVVFHNIAERDTPFTAGIRVSISPKKFEAALKFLTAHYTPVSLEDVLTECGGCGLPRRPTLVTFDDAYASVAEWAAPLCRQYGVPAVFFVNAAFLDNQRLAPDNLICYVANVFGIETVNAAIRAVPGNENRGVNSLSEVFGAFLPTISLADREVFLGALRHLSGIDERELLKESNLYLSNKQLRELKSFNFEIGNHTYSHPHCRSFSQNDFTAEVDRNKAELEALSGTKVRAFSVPYGSSKDLGNALSENLKHAGHRAVFLSESVANRINPDMFHLDRVSTSAGSEDALFFEIEVLSRLRVIRNRLSKKFAPARIVQPPSSSKARIAECERRHSV